MTSLPRLRTAKRFSSSRFSEVIRADKIPLIFSCSSQRSSTDIVSRSIFLIDIGDLTSRFEFNLSYYSVPAFASGCPELPTVKVRTHAGFGTLPGDPKVYVCFQEVGTAASSRSYQSGT